MNLKRIGLTGGYTSVFANGSKMLPIFLFAITGEVGLGPNEPIVKICRNSDVAMIAILLPKDVGSDYPEEEMRNRIATTIAPTVNRDLQELRPELTLSNTSNDRPFRVDMERFFDFTFSFAEALVDLEDRFSENIAPVEQLEPEEWEVDLRWM